MKNELEEFDLNRQIRDWENSRGGFSSQFLSYLQIVQHLVGVIDIHCERESVFIYVTYFATIEFKYVGKLKLWNEFPFVSGWWALFCLCRCLFTHFISLGLLHSF